MPIDPPDVALDAANTRPSRLGRVHILVSESSGFSTAAADRLRSIADVSLADLDRDGLLSEVPDADVLWVRLRHRIDEDMLSTAGRLRIIVTPTTGLNHIDLQFARRQGILVMSLRGESEFLSTVAHPAEHTLGLMLSLLRRLPGAIQHVNEGGWNRDRFKGRELHGKTVGIVGYGRLGRLVARFVSVFGARVLACDPFVDASKFEPDVARVELDNLLEQADLVSLHVNLTESNHGLFGKHEFERMRGSSWLVNTARGELVDERDLLESLQSGRLAGAALDVLCDEPVAADNPLVAYARRHDNLLLTPHIGGCTFESMEKTELFLANKLAEHLQRHRGRPLAVDQL